MGFGFGNKKAVSIGSVVSSVYPFIFEAWHSPVHFFRNKLKKEKVNVSSFTIKSGKLKQTCNFVLAPSL